MLANFLLWAIPCSLEVSQRIGGFLGKGGVQVLLL